MTRRLHRGSFPRRFIGPRARALSPLVVEEYYFDAPSDPDIFVERRELDEAGDLLPTFVTADDARRYIDETDTGYSRLNTAIATSSASPDFKAAWAIQLAGWTTFATGARATVGFLNAKAVMDQTDRWAAQLQDWSAAFAKAGGMAPGPAPPSPGQGTGKPTSLGDLTGLIVAAGVVAAIVIFGPRLAKG
jgi:hypothetical protein